MEITLSDCDEVLGAKLGATADYQLVSYNVKPLNEEKLGFMCEYHHLTVNYIGDNQETRDEKFFIKSLPKEEEHRNFCVETYAYPKEEAMYNKLVPMFLDHGLTIIRECIPECYLIKENNFLVFEDLRAKGYQTLPARSSLELPAVKVALISIAKFHACGFVLEEKFPDGKKLIDVFSTEFTECFYSDLKPNVDYLASCRKTVEAQIDLFAEDGWKIPPAEMKERIGRILDDFDDLVKPSATFRNTICHGDLWINNLMFKSEDEELAHCVLLDLQGYRYSPPAQDIMAFIYFSTNVEFRSKYLGEVLDFYHDYLGKILGEYGIDIETVVSRDDFAKSCDYYEAFGMAQAVKECQNIMIDSKMLKEMFDGPCGIDNVFYGDRSANFLQMCEQDEEYREKQREAVHVLRMFLEKIDNGSYDGKNQDAGSCVCK